MHELSTPSDMSEFKCSTTVAWLKYLNLMQEDPH